MKKRRMFVEAEDDTGNFDYLLFGNFDGLSIREAKKWYDFAPSIEADYAAAGILGEEIGNAVFQDEKYISTFLLKLLEPSKRPEGFQYDQWYCEEAEKGERDSFPFFSLIMLNVSEETGRYYAKKKNCPEGNPSSLLFQDIAKKMNEIKDAAWKLEWALFESLGYFDYIMLVRADSLKRIMTVSSRIKGLSLTSDGKKYPLFSTCHTILGIENWKRNGLEAEQAAAQDEVLEGAGKEIQKVYVDLHLKPGRSVDAVVEELRKAGVFCPGILFRGGSADVTLEFSGEDLEGIFPQYLLGGALNPGNQVFAKTVLTMKTTVYFIPEESSESDRAALPSHSDLLKEHCDQIFHDYRLLRGEEHLTQRLTTSLRQTVLRYLNVARYDHAFEIRYLLRPVFNSLFDNMERANQHLREDETLDPMDPNLMKLNTDEFTRENIRCERQYERERFWTNYDIALHTFREMVGGFLSDIALSDKYFIEDSQLKHPSIGSATKLIFFYNLLVDELSRAIQRTQAGERSSYSFLVKSGGDDEISVNNLFYFLPPYRLEDAFKQETDRKHCEDCLLVIEIPERILYNLQASLFAILHEIFHIVGNRSRQIRYEKTLKGISHYLAGYFGEFLFHADAFLELDAYKIIKEKMEKAEQDFFDRALEKTIVEVKAAFEEYIAEKIRTQLAAAMAEWNGVDLAERENDDLRLFSRNLYDALNERTAMLLLPDFQGNNILFQMIYREYIRRYGEILRWLDGFINEKKREWLSPVTPLTLLAVRIGSYDDDGNSNATEKNKKMNPEIVAKLWAAFESVMGNRVDDTILRDSDSSGKTGDRLKSNSVTNFLESNYVERVIDGLYDAMNESFSDYMAILSLDMTLEDYLAYYCCVREGSIEFLFPNSDETVLRLGCVLEVAYDVKASLSEQPERNIGEKITNKINEMNESGVFLHSIDAAALIDRIDMLLKECNDSYGRNGVKAAVVDYLAAAMKCNEEAGLFGACSQGSSDSEAKPSWGELMECIRTIYQDWDSDDCTKMKQHVLDWWLRLALKRETLTPEEAQNREMQEWQAALTNN